MAMEVEENGVVADNNVFSIPTHPTVHFNVDITNHLNPRPKHKSRRRAKVPKASDELEEEANDVDVAACRPLAASKLRKLMDKDRHLSRAGKGRGQPKKGGGGGKGTWGKTTEVYDDDGHTNDIHDPNYDSENEEDTYIVSPSSPQMSQASFDKQAGALFMEYFENNDVQEVAFSLAQFNIKNIKHEIVHLLVMIAMEKKPVYCEQASELISYLCGKVMNSREISHGFDSVLEELDDLILDTPNASDKLGNFIARAVADDCLPPAYIDNHFKTTNQAALDALGRAKLLLKMPHSHARLDHVWGVGGGQQPVLQLVEQIILLLKEYLSSGDKEEAVLCLQQLDVPHFHHEVVYEAIILVLEDGTELCTTSMVGLLTHMYKAGVVTPLQMEQGFLRVFGMMTELVLDAPFAYNTLTKLVERCAFGQLISPQLVEQNPQRGRKRFVSEGDGGAIKQ